MICNRFAWLKWSFVQLISGVSLRERGEGSKERPAHTVLINCCRLPRVFTEQCWDLATTQPVLRNLKNNAGWDRRVHTHGFRGNQMAGGVFYWKKSWRKGVCRCEVRKAVQVPRKPSSRDNREWKKETPWARSAQAQLKAALLWVAPGSSNRRVQRGWQKGKSLQWSSSSSCLTLQRMQLAFNCKNLLLCQVTFKQQQWGMHAAECWKPKADFQGSLENGLIKTPPQAGLSFVY